MKKYLITDPLYYTNDEIIFAEKLENNLQNNQIDIACFRDKKSLNFKNLAKLFIEICKKYEVEEILINSDYQLAKQLGATGVHLNSQQFDKISEAKNLSLYVVISCHNLDDIEKAQKNYVNCVTYSPIFDTPNKGKAKGISVLKQALSLYEDVDIIALGGIISEEQVKQISNSKAYGFASIRYFI
jgi:thiamine-phosphate pyrophosphorylase